MHCGGAGIEGENNKKSHSEWDWSVPWASRTFSEEVPLNPLKERRERGFHAWRAARTEAWMRAACDHSWNCQAHRMEVRVTRG